MAELAELTEIRFVKSTVTQVSNLAGEFTNGTFRVSEILRGARGSHDYVNSWSGDTHYAAPGAREVCAYMIGASLGWVQVTREPMTPAMLTYFRLVQNAYSSKEKYRDIESNAILAGEAAARRHISGVT